MKYEVKEEGALTKFITVVVKAFLTALIVWLLWNGLCPKLFHLPRITYWEAMGLKLLITELFTIPNDKKWTNI